MSCSFAISFLLSFCFQSVIVINFKFVFVHKIKMQKLIIRTKNWEFLSILLIIMSFFLFVYNNMYSGNSPGPRGELNILRIPWIVRETGTIIPTRNISMVLLQTWNWLWQWLSITLLRISPVPWALFYLSYNHSRAPEIETANLSPYYVGLNLSQFQGLLFVLYKLKYSNQK